MTGGEGSGAIAGYMTGTIENCINKATVNGTLSAGGVIGKFGGTIKYCQNYGTIQTTSTTSAGGILGILVGNTKQIKTKYIMCTGTIASIEG